MTRAAIGLGGNLGDAATTLRQAIEVLGALPGTRLLRASRLYRTPAWGLTAQPDFINAVAVVETTLAAMKSACSNGQAWPSTAPQSSYSTSMKT